MRSAAFGLQAGDVVLTGTPWGCGGFLDPPRRLRPGDTVEVTLEGIGTCSTRSPAARRMDNIRHYGCPTTQTTKLTAGASCDRARRREGARVAQAQPEDPGPWRIRLPCPWRDVPWVNAWAIPAPDGIVLVDTGVGGPGALETFHGALAEIGFGIEDIVLVVCTHSHIDHYGLASSICAEAGCELWMHPAWDHIRAVADPTSPPGTRWRAAVRSGAPQALLDGYVEAQGDPANMVDGLRAPDVELEGGARVSTSVGTWEVVETPGHAASHISLYEPGRGILIAGDHLLAGPGYVFDLDGTDDPIGDYKRSLERTAGLGARLCLPGHGRPFEDPQTKIDASRRQIEVLERRVVAALERRDLTSYELSCTLFGECEDPRRAWNEIELVGVVSRHLVHRGRLEATPSADDDAERWRNPM